jgi:hypothetical protein
MVGYVPCLYLLCNRFLFIYLFIYLFCLSGYVLRERNGTTGPRTMNDTRTALIAAAPNVPVGQTVLLLSIPVLVLSHVGPVSGFFLVFLSHSKQILVSEPVEYNSGPNFFHPMVQQHLVVPRPAHY